MEMASEKESESEGDDRCRCVQLTRSIQESLCDK